MTSRSIVAAAGASLALLLAGATTWVLATRRSGAAPEARPPTASEERRSGTTIYEHGRAYRGYNLYVQRPLPIAVLTDMDGKIVHRWTSDVGQPDRSQLVPDAWWGWRTVKMLPNGDLLVVVDRSVLLKLDFDSRVVWKTNIVVHHDVEIAEDGDIYAVSEAPRVVDLDGKQRLIRDHGAVVLSADGEVRRTTSLFDVLSGDATTRADLVAVMNRRFRKMDRNGVDGVIDANERDEDTPAARGLSAAELDRAKTLYRTGKLEGDAFGILALLQSLPGAPSDVFHANAVVPLKRHPGGAWEDGDVLMSVRNLNLLVVFNPKDGRVRWSFGPGELLGQHAPSVLPGGDLLIFDNGRGWGGVKSRGYARLVDLDPASKNIVWSYVGDPPKSFVSPFEGGAELLPNGDILAAEQRGRAFEVTRKKEIVWEYFRPNEDKGEKKHAGLYRLERVSPEIVEPLLARARPEASHTRSGRE